MTTEAETVSDADLYARVQRDFQHAGLMQHLGAQLISVAPGEVCIRLPFSPHLTQQLGYFHAGATSAIADAAGGLAARSLLPDGQTVLSVEFKINLLAPAQGEAIEATARVLRHGRTLTVAQVDVCALQQGTRKAVALMQQTLIHLPTSHA